MGEAFPADTVGAARDFLAASTGLPREKVAHYAMVTGDGEELTAIVTCCDDVDEAAVMLRTGLEALGSRAPVLPSSRSVMVSREDLRAALSRSGALPADIRERFREALGEADDA
jgi:hypothetical protein